MIDIFESRYPDWKREHVRNELKQWPKLAALILGAAALAFGIGVMF